MGPHPGLVKQLDLCNLNASSCGAHQDGTNCTGYCQNMGGPVQHLAIAFLQTLFGFIS